MLIAYTYGENDGSSLGIYIVSELEPTILVRSSDAQNGAAAAGVLVFVSGAMGNSESYSIFVVPSGNNNVWGYEYLYFIKYYKYLADGSGSVLVNLVIVK